MYKAQFAQTISYGILSDGILQDIPETKVILRCPEAVYQVWPKCWNKHRAYKNPNHGIP